jgi:hypothetical protein
MRWHAISRVIRVLLVRLRRSFARSCHVYGSRAVVCCSHVSSRVLIHTLFARVAARINLYSVAFIKSPRRIVHVK